ncbi:FkbM family methyltransferase [Flavobacterium sp. 7E]|uniref:FkbM family methyltransferase n=1 Tax=Flavobacterium sp. 7E TaxID=2735898 RepID=UPI00157044C6|nr:FkbM family methyltransferase [Flavobacterium sp. 7E]NRS89398.1 FkbM family methyltransferase [Flavobacterium sp. 7E]
MILDKLKRIIRQRYNISFSKSGDDIQLMKLINNYTPGVYVDIGCWHPIKASNTYYFHLRKWKGICIDPNPELKLIYSKYRSSDLFLNVGIGKSDTCLNYYMMEESSMNTFSLDFIKKHNLESKIIKKIEIPLFSLKEILDKNLNPDDRLDFFDVDAEGFDLEILKTNDWSKYRPKIILIESDTNIREDMSSEIVAYLESKNYRLTGKSIINGDLGNLILINVI